MNICAVSVDTNTTNVMGEEWRVHIYKILKIFLILY